MKFRGNHNKDEIKINKELKDKFSNLQNQKYSKIKLSFGETIKKPGRIYGYSLKFKILDFKIFPIHHQF